MVLGQAVSLLHGSPVLPLFFCLVYRSSPDLLSPDDVLEVECIAVLHAPLGNLFSRECSRTAAIRAHKVGRETTAMVGTSRTRAVSFASDLSDSSRERSNDLLSRIDRNRLASSHSWDRWRRVPSKASSGRGAALHLRWTGTLAGCGGASTVRRPAAVARGTLGLGTAFDVSCIGGTCARDGGTAGGTTGCIGDTDTCDAAGAIAGFVGCGEGWG